MTLHKINNKKGDSIIEVLIAVAIFSTIAVASLAIMNRGIQNSQSALETTIARTNIDTQAERIRFIADSADYRNTWNSLIEDAIAPLADDSGHPTGTYANFINNYLEKDSLLNCQGVISDDYHAFIIKDNLAKEGRTKDAHSETPSIPSIEHGGLFVVAIQGPSNTVNGVSTVEYYDFYINTCWNKTGEKTASKLTTTVRIKNPDLVATASIKTSKTDGAYLRVIYHFVGDNISDSDSNGNIGPSQLTGDFIDNDFIYENASGRYYEFKNDDNAEYTIGRIRNLPNNNRMGSFVFDGWYYGDDSNKEIGSGTIEYHCPSEENPDDFKHQRYECYWGDNKETSYDQTSDTIEVTKVDEDGNLIKDEAGHHVMEEYPVHTINLYAKWKYDPLYLFCIKYNASTLPAGAGSYTKNSLTGKSFSGVSNLDCAETPDTSATFSTSSEVFVAENSSVKNFKMYGWRTNVGTWGSYPAYYTSNATNGYIYKAGTGNITVGTSSSQSTKASEKLGLSDVVYDTHKEVHYVDLYPQWRAVLSGDIGVRIVYQEQYEGSVWPGELADDSRYKYLDPYIHRVNSSGGTNQSYYNNRSIDSGQVVMSDAENVPGRITGLHAFKTYDKDHAIATLDKNSFLFYSGTDKLGSYHHLNIPSTTTSKYYYSALNYHTGYNKLKINADDTVEISYKLRGGTDKQLGLNGVSDTHCWNVFYIDAQSGDISLYIQNTAYNTTNSNNCVATTSKFSKDIPF